MSIWGKGEKNSGIIPFGKIEFEAVSHLTCTSYESSAA